MKKYTAILISAIILISGISAFSSGLDYEYIDFGNVRTFEEAMHGYVFTLTDGNTVYVDEYGNVTEDKLSVIGSNVFYNKDAEVFEVYDNSGRKFAELHSMEYIVFDTAVSYVGVIHRAEYEGERRLKIYSKDSGELTLDANFTYYIADKKSEALALNKKGFFVCTDENGKKGIADPYGAYAAEPQYEKLNIYENGFFGLKNGIWYALNESGAVIKTFEGLGEYAVDKYCGEQYIAFSKEKSAKVFDSEFNPLFELDGYFLRDIPCENAAIVSDEDTYEWRKRGLVSWDGKVIVPTNTYIKYIGEGVFFADNLDDSGNRIAVLIKADGTVLAENVSFTTEIGDNGYIGVAVAHDGLNYINYYDNYYIDADGNRVLTLPKGYYLSYTGAFSEGRAAVVSDLIYTWYGKAAYINEQGEIILTQSENDNAPQWLSGGEFKNGVFRVYTHLGMAGPRGSLLVKYTGNVPSDWAKSDVEVAIADGYVPEALRDLYKHNITREEFCDLAAAVLKKVGKADGAAQSAERIFCDTDSASVALLYSKDIINGKDTEAASGKIIFDPDADITREEAAKILNRLMDVMYDPWAGLEEEPWNDTAEFTEYADSAQISDWAKAFVEEISKRTIMNGVEGGRFDPQGGYTREQSIVTMRRLLNFDYNEPWIVNFDNEDKFEHAEGHDPTYADGVSGFTAEISKNEQGEFDISGENVGHLWSISLQNDSRYGGVQFGFSLVSAHMENDPELIKLCMDMSTIRYDAERLQDNADIANEHVKIQVNGKDMEIKDVRQGKGNGHMDFYFVLADAVEKDSIETIKIVCE